MGKTNEEMFKDIWEVNFTHGFVFGGIRSILRTTKHMPESRFKDIANQLDGQLVKLSRYEHNAHNDDIETHYKDIGEVYKADFEMIEVVLKIASTIWPTLYTEEFIKRVKDYIKDYEQYITKFI